MNIAVEQFLTRDRRKGSVALRYKVRNRSEWVGKLYCCLDQCGIAVAFVANNRHRLIAPNCFACLTHKCPCRIGVSPRRELEIDRLPVLIDSTPKVAPASVHSDVGFIPCSTGYCTAMPERGHAIGARAWSIAGHKPVSEFLGQTSEPIDG